LSTTSIKFPSLIYHGNNDHKPLLFFLSLSINFTPHSVNALGVQEIASLPGDSGNAGFSMRIHHLDSPHYLKFPWAKLGSS
jgi:hypothetical protein